MSPSVSSTMLFLVFRVEGIGFWSNVLCALIVCCIHLPSLCLSFLRRWIFKVGEELSLYVTTVQS